MTKNTSKLNMIWLIFLSVLFILLSKLGSLDTLYDISSGIAYKLNSDSYQFFTKFNENVKYFQNLRNIKETNDILTEENIKLNSEKVELQQQLNDVDSVIKQLDFDLKYTLEPVRVIRINERSYGEIVINKGTSQGIIVGDILIFEQYAIGEVIKVMEKSAIVRLIIAPESSVPAITMATETKGLVEGSLSDGLQLVDILIDQNLEDGDIVITSGVNNSYPYGLILGSIDIVKQINSEIVKTAILKNEIDFNSLDKLFIIVK